MLEGNYAKQFAMADEEDDGPNFDVCDDMDGDHASALASYEPLFRSDDINDYNPEDMK